MGSSDTYDFVVFGATGFTGQYVVEELAVACDGTEYTWAIAGRSMEKLQKVLAQASKQTGLALEEKPILMADMTSDEALMDMCKAAKVLLNCVGPYRFFGEKVVKACIENKTHHLDISGEPQYLEKMQLLYHGKAKENSTYIIGACGFDSIPADMGLIFLKNNWGAGEVNSAENYVETESGPDGGGAHYATWQSAIYGFAHAHELKSLRKQLYPSPLPKPSFRQTRRSVVFHSKDVNGYCVPFPGSDRSVVQRTERYIHEQKNTRPVQFQAYYRAGNLLATLGLSVFGIIFGLLASFSFGRTLLEKFPRLFSAGKFSHEGPSRKQIADCTFWMLMIGEGWQKKMTPEEQHKDQPDKKVRVKISGPEAGYVTTPRCMVAAALCLVEEPDKLPAGGGVYTPGAAFADTQLMDRLQKRDIKFEVLPEE
ncbi:saccharopine dehydrogenase-like oxidoreductase [Lineus longissimus]|uniref:saccharopine dehydrogenase-like oxidoreductase n=1 Tax=Lineus longissimus TaxID=88925 RepID=UPI002B4EF5A7